MHSRCQGQDHHGTVVGLHLQQQHGNADQEQRHQKSEPSGPDPRPMPFQVRSQINHQQHLRRFRGLQGEQAEIDPARRAVHFPPDSRQQHDGEQGIGADQQQPVEPVPEIDRHQHQRQHQDQAKNGEQRLPPEEVKRIPMAAGGNLDGGRSHHQQAECEQHQGQQQQRARPRLGQGRGKRRPLAAGGGNHRRPSTQRAKNSPRC